MTTLNTPVSNMSFNELRELSALARRKAEQARKAKRAFRLYVKLAEAIELLVQEHLVLVQLTQGLVAQLSTREKLEQKEARDADLG